MGRASSEERKALRRWRLAQQLIAPGRTPLDLRDLLLALLSCPLLDELPRGGGKSLSEEDVAWFKAEARPYLKMARAHIMSREAGSVDQWLEAHWFPVTPRSERVEACQWTDFERGALPEQLRMPVTAVSMYVVRDVYGAPLREVQRRMRDVALAGTQLKSTRRSSRERASVGAQLGHEMLRSRGVGWHHGGE